MSRNITKKHKEVSENMKKKIIGLLLILAIMASIPLVFNNKKLDFKPFFKNKSAHPTKSAVITGIAANNFRKRYSGETLKAIILILNTNYRLNKADKKDYITKSDFIKKYKKGKEYYSKIEKTVNNMKDEFITYHSKPVYIPYFKTSKGYTEKSKKYPYLNAVGCPWDKLKKDYKSSNNSLGVSINSLDKICSLGVNYKDAVKRFLKSE